MPTQEIELNGFITYEKNLIIKNTSRDNDNTISRKGTEGRLGIYNQQIKVQLLFNK